MFIFLLAHLLIYLLDLVIASIFYFTNIIFEINLLIFVCNYLVLLFQTNSSNVMHAQPTCPRGAARTRRLRSATGRPSSNGPLPSCCWYVTISFFEFISIYVMVFHLFVPLGTYLFRFSICCVCVSYACVYFEQRENIPIYYSTYLSRSHVMCLSTSLGF